MAIISPPPVQASFDKGNDNSPDPSWIEFESSVFKVLSSLIQSGTTAQRPVKFLYVGRPYFDTSLGAMGKPIWIGKDGVTWVLADGTLA